MELSEMTINDVIERINQLDVEVRDSQDVEAVKKAMEEKKALLERKQELLDLETRKAEAQALTEKTVEPDKIIEIVKPMEEERKMTQEIEMRDTLEYGKAFVKAMLSGDDTEARSLLSTNVSGGSLPVPTQLDNEIRNAWEETAILSKAKQTAYPGNVKVGFEYSATGAVIHTEGSAAPDEETLVLGTVELKAESIKKWITVSDEAIDGTTIDTLGYIYKELAQKIAEKAEEVLIGKITASPATSTTTAPAVPVYNADTLAEDTIIMALAELSGKAKNITLAMNRRTYAAVKAVAAKAKYAVDPFDGLKDKVVFTDALPAFSSATAGQTYIIAGDFGYGAQANRPNGNELKLVVDEKSLAEKDLVKVVGKQYVGIGVVAPKAFVKVKKADAE